MSNFLNYRYRIDLKDEQKKQFDELYRCYVALFNDMVLFISSERRAVTENIDINLKVWYQNLSARPEACYIRKNFSPLMHYLRQSIQFYERQQSRGWKLPKQKNPFSAIASLSFYPGDANLRFRRTSEKMTEVNLLPFGAFPLHYHRNFPESSRCVLMTLKREIDRKFYFDFLLDRAYSTLPPAKKIGSDDILGIDFSVKHFFVSTDDSIVPNMKMILPSKNRQRLIKLRQKNYIRSETKSNNRERKRMLYVKTMDKMKKKRRQYFYILSHQIFDKYEAVGMETLQLSKMKESKSYAKTITNECFYEFETILQEVALKEGKRIIRIPKWYPSSKICFHCGMVNKNLKVHEKEWICPNCGKKINRDKNAASNIRKKAREMIHKKA